MCGIAGIYSTEPVAKEVVVAMLETIGYRGPDHIEAQCYQGAHGGFLTVGQARLAILDLTPEANQPFESQDNKSCLTFNGEFYNFQDLKAELTSLGQTFHTRSDTEVALAALNHWDVDGLNRLWGMFAGAWFQEQGRLMLFRDRFGKKPLYLYPHKNRLYFASEPKAILKVLDHIPQPDNSALSSYFYLGYIPSHACAYQGMFKIPAGHYMEVDPKLNRTLHRWYKPENEPVPQEHELESIFMDAVSKRMISDVPLAAFLSGGLDSSLVVAAMSRMSSQTVNTFSVKFEGAQVLDESQYARLVARHCGTQHHEVVLNIDNLLQALPRVLEHFDEPFGDASAVPSLVVSEACRKQFTVALSGDGADEIFAGYRKYLGPHYLKKLGPYWLRQMVWKPLSRLTPTGRTNRFLETARRVRRLLEGDAPTAAVRHVNWLHMSPLDQDFLSGPLIRGLDVKSELVSRLPSNAGLNDCLVFDQNLVLQDDMFVKVDRMSMMASLEVRSPFVDHRLIQLANNLHPERKLQGTLRKRTLVEGLGHLVPPQILTRPKTGFEMPTGAWLRSELKSWAQDRLFHYADTEPWVDRQQLKKVWNLHCSGKLDCTEALWFQLVFATWIKGVYG